MSPYISIIVIIITMTAPSTPSQIKLLLQEYTHQLQASVQAMSAEEPLPKARKAALDQELHHYSQLQPILARLVEEGSTGNASPEDNSRFW